MELACVVKTNATNLDLGDLMLGDDGDEVVLTDLGLEVGQRLTIAFNFFKGEWFLDLDEGTPWFQYIFRKGVRDRIIRAVLGQVILSVEGVATLNKFSYEISKQRVMSVRFDCTLEDSSTFRSTNYAPFVIQL